MINPKFKEKVLKIRQKMSKKPFFIIIWGPDITSNSYPSLKRQKIKKYLSEKFGSENVIFPEENDPDLKEWQKEWGGYAKEFFEVKAADVMIIIPESIGSITETALYRKEIAEKSLLFVERRKPDNEGFAAQAHRGLKVEVIEPEEWKSCERIRRLACEFIEIKRIEKYGHILR